MCGACVGRIGRGRGRVNGVCVGDGYECLERWVVFAGCGWVMKIRGSG